LQGRVIRLLMEKYRIEHKVGGGPKLSPAKRAAIAAAIGRREDHIYRLAKKFGVAIGTVRSLAREVTGVVRFTGYPNIEPMTAPTLSHEQIEKGCEEFLASVLRGNFSKELIVSDLRQTYIELVQSFAQNFYGGEIPSDRAGFIVALVESYMPKIKPPFVNMLTTEEYDQQRVIAAGYIRQAVEACAGSRWTN